MVDERKAFNHTVSMYRRSNTIITGVLDVISFDDETVISETHMGVLIIRGTDLHVNRLNVENGELSVEGEVMSISYEESPANKGKRSLFGNLFK